MNEVTKEVGYFESFDGTKLYYESHGEGDAIVLVYGICCLLNHWHHQISHFSQNYRVIVFDIRGHHKSDVPKDKDSFTIAAVSQDVDALLKHLNIEKAHLMGHSFGVPVAVQFASDHPKKVRSLALINGFVNNPIKGMFGLDVIEPLYYFIKAQYEAAPALWNQIWKYSTNNPLAMVISGIAGGFNLKLTQFKDIEIYARGVSRVPLSVFLPFFADLMRFDGKPMLSRIHVPSIVISGEKDAVTPLKFQEELHHLLKGSDFFVVPYGSHCTQLDFPDFVNLKLESHLRKAD